MRSLPDRLAGLVRTLDWASTCLRQDGIEVDDIATASDELAAIRLDIECGRVLVIERPFTAPVNSTATIRQPLRVAAIGAALVLALASVPAWAQAPVPPDAKPPVWVQPVPTQDSALQRKQEINGEFANEMQQLATAAQQLAIQRQTLDVLREIAADIEAMQMRQARAAP